MKQPGKEEILILNESRSRGRHVWSLSPASDLLSPLSEHEGGYKVVPWC